MCCLPACYFKDDASGVAPQASGWLTAEKPPDPPCVGRRRGDLFVEHSADPRRLGPAQMALWTLGPQNLARAGYVKSALRALVGLNLRHLVLGTSVGCAGSRASRHGRLVRRKDDAE